jgi:hypothetical protein
MTFVIRRYARSLSASVLGFLVMMSSFAKAATAPDGTGLATSAAETMPWKSPNEWFIYIVVIAVFLASIIALLLVKQALSGTKWSLSDALSEEADVTATEVVNGVTKPTMDNSGKPLQITEMRASSSRFIALMGMISILIMYLGFGTFLLYGFAKTGRMPDSIDTVVKFLVSGLTLFAPYVVNKFSSMFQSITGGK